MTTKKSEGTSPTKAAVKTDDVKAVAMEQAKEIEALKAKLEAAEKAADTNPSALSPNAKAKVETYTNCCVVVCENMSELEFTMLSQRVGAFRKVYDAESKSGTASVYTNGGSKKANREQVSRVQSVLASL